MSKKTAETLDLLTEVLVTIRAMSSAASGGPYSLPGRPFHDDPKAACRAIQSLADAAHNLPAAISATGPQFLLDDSLARTRAVLDEIKTASIEETAICLTGSVPTASQTSRP